MGEVEKEEEKSLPLRRVLAVAAREKGRIVAGVFFMLVARLCGLALLGSAGWMVDATMGNSTRFSMNESLWVLAGILLVQSVASPAASYLLTIAGERLIAWLRNSVFENVLQQEISFFDSRETGELTSRISSDTTRVQVLVTESIPSLIGSVITLFGAIVLLIMISPPLTGVMLVLVPPTVIGAMFYGKRIRKLSRAVQDAVADAGKVATESISGIRTVRSFAREPQVAEKHREAIDRSFSLARKRTIQSSIFGGVTLLAAFGGLAVVFWYGATLMSEGEISMGAFMSYMLYTFRVSVSVGMLGHLWTSLMSVSGSAQRVFEILDRQSAIERSGGKQIQRVSGAIAFQGVRFEYPSRPDVLVLRDISFGVEPGQVVALVGPSGAGKSTIASLLLRFYDPTGGRVLLDGHDLVELDPHWLRGRIGIVSQEPILFSESILENIRYGRTTATEAEARAAARVANADEFVMRFPEGYATQVGERGIRLSAGQKQRIAIARAVLEDPVVLILDEATSALDAESEALVKEALDRLTEKRTTIVIAHRLSTVRNADRVIVLENGRVAEEGTHDELMRFRGVYERFVRLQLGGAGPGS